MSEKKGNEVKKIKPRDRNEVLIKVGIVILLPMVLLLFALLLGIIEKSPCPFDEEHKGSNFKFTQKNVYPDISEKEVRVQVSNDGLTDILEGATTIWQDEFEETGKFYPGNGAVPYFSIFWLPVPHGVPLLDSTKRRELEDTAVIDLNGFLGNPGRDYAIEVGDIRHEWKADTDHVALREVKFITGGQSVVGTASYDAFSGVLVSARSFVENGARLSLDHTNFRPLSAGKLMFFLALLFGTVLVFYDIVRSTAEQLQGQRKGISIKLEFLVLGYSAVLVDVFYDFFFSHQAGNAALFAIHLLIIALFWYRLGWWVVPLVIEVLLGIESVVIYDTMLPATAYFPAALITWFLCLVTQGNVSPGSFKWLKKDKEKMSATTRIG